MKILVGSLYCIENEYKDSLLSLERQTYKNFELFKVEKVSNKKAHDTLYQTFMQNADNFDLFVKLDADMVLCRNDFLELVVKVFRGNPDIGDLQIGVHDFFTDRLIYGLHVYNRCVTWNLNDELVFVDMVDNHRKRVQDMEVLAPAAWHCPNPSEFQSFHFGIHKAVKVWQIGSQQTSEHGRSVHLDNILKLKEQWLVRQDARLGYAMIGALEGILGKCDYTYVDFESPKLEKLYQNYQGLSLNSVADRIHLLESKLKKMTFETKCPSTPDTDSPFANDAAATINQWVEKYWGSTKQKGSGGKTNTITIKGTNQEHEGHTADSPIKVTFVAYGPNQLNGPNIWLQRILPELHRRNIVPKVLFLMISDSECSVINRLRHFGIPCDTIAFNRYTELNVKNILSYLKKDPPDIFVPNLSIPAYWASRWVKAAGIPTVGIIRSDDNFHHEIIEHFVSGLPDFKLSGVVCKSEYLEKAVRVVPSHNLKVMRSASGTLVPDHKASKPRNIMKVVYSGRLVQRQKRIFETVEVLQSGIKAIPGISATVYGEDREGGRVVEFIRASGLGDAFKYGGVLQLDEIFPTLLQHHVFILLSDYEGLSTSLMEAMAAGLVPICTKTQSGSTEIIKHNFNGLFVNNRKDDVLAALRRLKTEKGLWEKLSRNARKTIKENYTTELCADRWHQFLKDLTHKRLNHHPIQVPQVGEMGLPTIKATENGIVREDNRLPSPNQVTPPDSFLNPHLCIENMDLFLIRTRILQSLKDCLPRFHGRLLDVGCGTMPYRQLIEPHVDEYIGLDIENPHYQRKSIPHLFWDGKRIPLNDGSVDCAMATELIEHLPNPEAALMEVNRVLKPNGFLFFTVPFLWPIHDAPHDECRYTPFALERILKAAGFSDIALNSLGGWDAALAQMIGLWVRRKPMSSNDRQQFMQDFFPFYKSLIASDERPVDFGEGQMITGLSGLAFKPLSVEKNISLNAISKNNHISTVKEFGSRGDEESVASTIASEQCTIENASNPSSAIDRKRIVIVTDEFPVLTETFIRDQVQGLLNRNFPIEIWTRKVNKSLLNRPELSKPEILQRIRLIKLPPDDVCQNTNQWRAIFFQNNPDVDINAIHSFHVHFGWNFNLLEPLFDATNALVVVSFHGYDGSAFIKEHGPQAYAKLFDRANILTTPSHYMKKALVEAGCPSAKLKVHRYGIDLSKFAPSVRPDTNSNVVLLSVARLVEKKGIEYALRAFSQIPRKIGATFRIVGDGPLRPRLEKLATKLSIQDRVVFLGAQDHEDVRKEMSLADIFVLTSITSANGDQEGVPVGLIEAQAMGLPVVSSNHAGIPELVSHQKSGYLADEKNVDQIARYLLDLIQGNRMRAEFSLNARQIVKKHFDIETLNDRLGAYLTQTIPGIDSSPGLGLTHQPPSVSIVIPTHKRPVFLKQAIGSALAQDFQLTNTEILIIADGHDDETERVVKAFPSNHIRYVQKEHSGAVNTRNMAIEKANGDYILWLDDDDLLEPNALSTHLSVLSKHRSTDVVYGKLHYFDSATGKFTKYFEPKDWYANSPMLLSTLVNGCCIPNPGTLVKKKVYENVGLYNEDFLRAHDYEFWTRAASILNFKLNDNVICRYRIHANNMSFGNKIDFSYESLIIRKMVDRYGRKRLYYWLDWDKPNEAKIVSNYFIARSLYAFGDYFNCFQFLSQIPQSLWTKDILYLAFHCSLFLGETMSSGSELFATNRLLKTSASKFNQLSKGFKRALSRRKVEKCRQFLVDFQTNGFSPPSELLLKVGRLFNHCGANADAKNAFRRAQMLNPYIFDQNEDILSPFNSADKADLRATTKRLISNNPLHSIGKSGDQTENKKTDSHCSIQMATLQYESEDYRAAKDTLRRIIALEPNHWEAYSLLVDVMQQAAQEAMIVEELRPIEDRSDLPARILALIGSGYEAIGDIAQAEHFADKAIGKEAYCARALNLKGVIAYRNDHRPEAAQYFQSASECDEEWGDPWTNMGTLHWEQGTHDKALQCFEFGLQLSPTSPNVATAYHIAVSQTGKYEQAREIFKDIVSRHPDFRKGRFLYVDILIQLSDYQEAWSEIQDLIERFGADPQLLKAAEAVKSKIPSVAQSASDNHYSEETVGCGLDGNDTPIRRTTIVYISGKSRPRTKQELLKKLKIHEHHTELIVLSGKSTRRRAAKTANPIDFKSIVIKAHDTPGRVLNKVMARSTGDTIIMVRDNVSPYEGWLDDLVHAHDAVPQAGLSGPLTNHSRKALQKYSNEGALSPSASPKRFSYRRIPIDSLDDFCVVFSRSIFEHCGPFDERFLSLTGLLQDFGRELKLNGYRSHVLADMVIESSSQIETKATWPVGINPKDRLLFAAKWNLGAEANAMNDKAAALAWREHAHQSYLKEAFSQAVEALTQAIEIEPDNADSFHILADVISQSGQSPEFSVPLNALDSIAGHTVYPAETLAVLGSCYELYGDLEKAENLTNRALDTDSDCALAWNLKGVISYRHQNHETAYNCFQRAIECDPGWGDPCTNLGNLYWQDGNTEKGCELFARGFALSPTAPHVAASYHAAITACGRIASARPHFAEVAFRYPGFRKGRHLYIDVLIQLEDYRAALNEIQDIIVCFGADPDLINAAKAVRQKLQPSDVSDDNRPSLSLCMIVKDEERHIAACLANLKSLADEIIVVDTGSTDNTRAIAEIFEARVYDLDWQNDFAAARNFSLEKARGDWILIMDADEIIAPEDQSKIQALVSRRHRKADAFSIVTRNYTRKINTVGWVANTGMDEANEAGTGWFPSEKVRLFKNDPRFRFEFPVHELVEPSLKAHGAVIKKCAVPVHHYGKLDSEKATLKGEQYYQIGFDKLDQFGHDPNALRELAVQAGGLAKFEEACDLWNRLLDIVPQDYEALISLSGSLIKLNQYAEASKAAQKAITVAPHEKEGYLNLGISALHLGRSDQAFDIFDALVKRESNYYAAVFLLGIAAACCGRMPSAVKVIKRLRPLNLWHFLPHTFKELTETLSNMNRQDYVDAIISLARRLGFEGMEFETPISDTVPRLPISEDQETLKKAV